jgi:hypothetical protein
MSKAQELRDRLDEPEPEVWQPKNEPVLAGVIESIAIRPGQGDKPSYPAVVVVGEDGVRRVWLAWHSVAKSRLKELKPRVGESIGVKYLGTHEKGYENYRLVLDRPEPTAVDVDWSKVDAKTPPVGDQDDDGWWPPEDESPVPF